MASACVIPPPTIPIIIEAGVTRNPQVCREHHKLTLQMQGFPSSQPGHFVHLIYSSRGGDRPGFSDELVVRRAFSIGGLRCRSDRSCIDVIYRVVGRGTLWMSRLKPGDVVSVLGPLGNTFTIGADKRRALLVAGGVGLPPLLWWAESLSRRPVETIAYIGAQSGDLFPLTLNSAGAAEEFDRLGVRTVLSTDDGSLGHHGYITEALEEWVAQHRPQAQETCLYACGPEPMMRRVAELAEQWHIDCQLCMERSMACGMGTCQSCVVPVHDARAVDGWRYKLCCTDGPVFNRKEIVWD